MTKKIFLILLCTLLGAVFLFSGFTKLYPIEPFEYTFVDIGLFNWRVAPFIARLFISLELVIGFLLVINLQLRRSAYKLGIATLIIFSIYLLLLMVFSGNNGNCGCFGTYLPMTPLQALLKNLVMLGVFAVLYKYHEGWELNTKFNYLIALPYAGAFVIPFILNPVELNYSSAYLNKPESNFKIELDTLYKHAQLTKPPAELSKGKQLLVFLSLTCPHCRIAANKIRIIHKRNPMIPFYFVLNGDEADLKNFYTNTHSEAIPSCILLQPYFLFLSRSTNLPVIYLVNNAIVVGEFNYVDLDQSEIEKWLIK